MFKFIMSLLCVVFLSVVCNAQSYDLDEIKKRGELRHIGVPYAKFITGLGDGLSVDIIKEFTKYLGVKYIYVESSWANVLSDLSGKKFKVDGDNIKILGETKAKGDLIGTGLTILPWRKKLVNYANSATFPSQVWLMAKASDSITPIVPTNDILKDIELTKMKLKNHSVLGKAKTCLDPALYNLSKYAKEIKLFNGSVNDLIPASISEHNTGATILDVPDALIALEKWTGKIKVIGPISEKQTLAVAFPKTSPRLKKEFDIFFKEFKRSGKYMLYVKKYHSEISILKLTFPNFFKR